VCANGDVVGVALDCDGHTLTFYKNGAQVGTPLTGLAATSWCFAASEYGTATFGNILANFGATSFAYAPPAGYAGIDSPPPTPGQGAGVMQPMTALGSRLAAGAGVAKPMTAAGGFNGKGSAAMLPMTLSGSGGPRYGQGIMLPMTASATGSHSIYGTGVEQPYTGTGTGVTGGTATGFATREAYAGTGAIVDVNYASGDATLQQYTAFGFAPPVNAPVRELYVATGAALNGGIATGAAVLQAYAALGAGSGVNPAAGAPSLQARTAAGTALATNLAAGAATLAARWGLGAAVSGTVAAGSPILLPRTAVGAGYNISPASGAITLPPRRVYARGVQGVDGTIGTWVMNTRNNAMSSYQAYPYNSFARYNGEYLAAGPTGLYVVDSGTTDSGAPIAWDLKTGMHDDNKPELKRLLEVLLAMRYDGPVQVTVWESETVSYTYPMANYQPDYSLHQARVKAGKGLRSRYYQVEVSGVGPRAEIASLQMTMPPTTRRVG
jgi:hypothetical protein